LSAVTELQVAASDIAAEVTEREYLRLLGWPRGRALSEELSERAQGARAWYAEHGRPFVATRRIAVHEIGPGDVRLESCDVLTSEELAGRLRSGEAHALVVVAVTAGREVADEAARLWADGRPDAAFFLDRLAAVITETLIHRVSSGLCRDLAPRHERLLPHLSPGCGHWDLADQNSLMGMLSDGTGGSCGPVSLLASGALKPQHSMLAAFGVSHGVHAAVVADSSCRGCDLDPCGYRRARFRSNALHSLGTT
jgi:hypothetical protein